MAAAQKLSDTDVAAVAALAKLPLEDNERERYASQLSAVIGYVELLDELDTASTPGTFQVIDGATNCWREDEIAPGLSQEEALSQAPRTHEGYVVVERIL